MEKKEVTDARRNYTATGTFEKIESGRASPQFVINGEINERWFIDGKTETKRSKGSAWIPERVKSRTSFLKTIPSGAKIIFRESACRDSRQYAYSFSFRVLK